MREIYLTSDDKNNVFFVVMFEYRPHIVDAIKKIPQRKFDKETKAWYVRADHTTVGPVIRFADEFGFVLHAEVQSYIEKLKKPIDENISIPSLKLTLRDFQKIGVAKAIRFERCFIADEMGLGKAQTLDSKILTPTGWKKMGDISVGDTIINSNGLESIVTGVFDRGIRDVYEVIFNDGSKTITCDEHLWNIQPIYNRSKNFGFVTKELKEFKDDLYTEDGNNKWFIPMIKPIHFNHIDVEIDPYLMGVILGDGDITKCVTISSNDDEIIENLKKTIDDSLYIKQKDKQNYIIKNKKPGRQKNKLKQSLNKLKLFGHKSECKFIPHDYMYNSISFRESLLQGLLDTHGLITEDGSTIEYYTSSYQLKEDVKFLVQSLGGTAKELFKTPTFWHNDVNKKGLVSYTLRIKLPAEITPFRLKRKLNRCNADINGPYRAFKSVKYIGKEETRCISTSADDRLYVTDDCILTHNTCQAIAAVEKLNAYPCLVITPASLKLNWEKEVKMWTDRRPNVIEGLIKDVKDDNGNIIDYIEPDYSGDFVIINYDILARDKNKKKDVNDDDDDYSDERESNDPEEKEDNFQSVFHKDFLKLKKFKSIIIDESHYCRNRKSSRTIAVRELAKEIRYRFALSGTPMINRPSELIPQLVILDRLESMGGFWTYAKKYCDAKEGRFGWDLSGFSNLRELHDKLVETCFIRRRKSDVLSELPEKQRSMIPLKIDNRQDYDEAKEDLIKWLSLTLKPKISGEVLSDNKLKQLADSQKKSIITRRINKKLLGAKKAETLVKIEYLKQLCARGKLAKFKEFVDNFIQSGEKLVIFATHKEIYQELIEEYKDISVHIVGGSSNKHKQDAVDKFQTDSKIKLFIGAIDAAGVGHTLTAASNVAFIEFGWTSAVHDQAEDRCHRIGQKNFVNCHYFYGVDTIDEYVLELIDRKRKITSSATDGEIHSINDDDLEELINKFIS